MFALLAEALVRRRRVVLAAVAIVTLAAAAAAQRIRFDFTPQALFAGNDDLVAYAEEFNDTFEQEASTLLIVVEATGERDVLDRRLLTWQVEVLIEIARLPNVERVDAVATMAPPRIRLRGPPWFKRTPLIRQLPVDERTEQRVREVVERSRLIEGMLISADRRAGAMAVAIDPEIVDVDGMQTAIEQIKAALTAHQMPPGYRLHFSGLPAIRVDIIENLKVDQRRLVPLVGGLFLVLLAVLFRSAWGAVLPPLAVGVGLVWTLAVLAMTGQSFNIISNVLPMLLLILGISNSVHLVTRYVEESAASHDDWIGAARFTIKHLAAACLLATITTAVGFLSLLAANSQVLRAFGWQAALGMGLLYVSTVVVVGATLPLFHPHARRGERSLGARFIVVIESAGTIAARYPRTTLGGCLLVVAASLWFARGVVVDSYLIETYDDRHPTIQSMRFVEKSLSAFIPLEISLQAEDSEQLLLPETFRRVAIAEQFAETLTGVTLARSYVDIHREIYRLTRGRGEADEELPPPGEAGAERIRWTQRVVDETGASLAYRRFMSEDGRRGRVLLRIRDLGTRRNLAMIAQLQAKLDKLFPAAGGIEVRLTGDGYISSRAMDGLIRDIFHSLLAASLVIFAIIALLFRSLRLGLIAVIPNLTPLVITLGYMGLVGYAMNASNVIIFAISLGIAVDDTIHFLARFREEQEHNRHSKTGADATEAMALAIRRTFRGTGRAIVLTSVLIVCGLSVLLLSEFVPTRRFAELTSVTIVAALLGDLLLLPACLVLFARRSTM